MSKTKTEQDLTELIKDGQSGKYKPFVRNYTGRIRQLITLKNPLDGSLIVDDINRILEILDPELKGEALWFKDLRSTIKLWCNEKITTNRILGLSNDNEYDTRMFEAAIMQKFLLREKPKPDVIIKTDFQTMVDLVEMGARRFGQ